ncbi:nicotinamide riboside transporter PnuC [Vagococcus carniphilus]|uniref:Nicotinamide mononucleotide transporter n=1 Tax=Vagococcus carniphilus TaxID=218144 RepID=A0A430B765_9ENTE|nr:nicotinamide riboside transporter PnuC [Vagococcus carniphilus]QNN72399.1 nicotinamide mononucleotide transporter [Vagococcus carniphilus]RSU16155.1 nicotinamide mononucleotide transporter [Vagococcus carniphilus]
MTTEKKSWLYQQLFTGWKKFEITYIIALLALQVIAYLVAPDSIIGMISGLSGVICLVYGMKGRKITFIFGFIQTIAMTYIAWKTHAYGSFAMNIVYVISQPIGWFLWGNDEAVNSFSASVKKKLFIGAFFAWLIGWGILANVGGQLPYFDSINLVISLIAQTLYIFKYKENWSLWIFVNIANLIYWSLLTYRVFTGAVDIGTLGGCLSQVALQAALLFNSIYANKVWNDYESSTENA